MNKVYNVLLLSMLFCNLQEAFSSDAAFTEENIKNSVAQIRNLRNEVYDPNAVKQLMEVENPRAIGTLLCQGVDITYVFRGPLGIKELKSCQSRETLPLAALGFNIDDAAGHKGYGLIYQSMRQNILTTINEHLEKNQLSPAALKLHGIGYSRGAAFVAFATLDLKERYPEAQLDVVTFGGPNVFDEVGTAIYNSLVGNHHLSFVTDEDSIARCPNISSEPLGKVIKFSAANLPVYKDNVKKRGYADLDLGFSLTMKFSDPWLTAILESPGVTSDIYLDSLNSRANGKINPEKLADLRELGTFVLPNIYEAHNLLTYEAGAPEAFRQSNLKW